MSELFDLLIKCQEKPNRRISKKEREMLIDEFTELVGDHTSDSAKAIYRMAVDEANGMSNKQIIAMIVDSLDTDNELCMVHFFLNNPKKINTMKKHERKIIVDYLESEFGLEKKQLSKLSGKELIAEIKQLEHLDDYDGSDTDMLIEVCTITPERVKDITKKERNDLIALATEHLDQIYENNPGCVFDRIREEAKEVSNKGLIDYLVGYYEDQLDDYKDELEED